MGHGWDHGVPSVDVWRELLRVLRPGAHVLAFGGTRTFHRLTCAIEDAGFEIRDCMMWLYGSGFPKSHDVSKAIDREAGAKRTVLGPRVYGDGHVQVSSESIGFGGCDPDADTRHITAPATEVARQWEGHGTALKPAWEPIIVARKPLDGTVAQNVQRWGCGGFAIDACRVGEQVYTQEEWTQKGASRPTGTTYGTHRPSDTAVPLGRWPANVILDDAAGQALDAQSGNRPGMSGGGKHKPGSKGGMFGAIDCEHTARGDSGGASRFFYCPKASRAERNAGVEANTHPTVKPLALARYLARLILPPIPDARMVVPFCGSGSEVIGALQAGWSHVDGIDSWDVAVDIARARVAHWGAK
jgi:site-specific DNA-methyltransferase (adenine-specific)